MAKSDSVCTTYINHITWDDGSLVFYCMNSKGYQEAVNEPWHISSNPTNPFICTFLALTMHVLCNSFVANRNCKRFEFT